PVFKTGAFNRSATPPEYENAAPAMGAAFWFSGFVRCGGLRGCEPSRWARAIAGEAVRLVADPRLGPGENSVRIVERPTIPPAIDRRAFSLRRRADPVEGSV